MNAMILAAGFGTRLKPLTDTTPKPLLKIQGKEMLLRILEHLAEYKINKVVINLHYKAEQISKFIERIKNRFAFEIITEFEEMILDTGGGVFNCENYLKNDHFFLYNADIHTNVDLNILIERFYLKKEPLALLLTQDREEQSYLKIDSDQRIMAFVKQNKREDDQQQRYQYRAFCGIHLINKNIFQYSNKKKKLSIIDFYHDCLSDGKALYCADIGNYQWYDIGSKEQYYFLNM